MKRLYIGLILSIIQMTLYAKPPIKTKYPETKQEVVKDLLNTKVEVSPFTEQVHKRQYFIARLKKTVDFLAHLQNTPYDIAMEFITHVDESVGFEHHFIKELVHQMHQTKSLEPVILTWNDFMAYKLLDDDIFLDDFTKLILILSKKLLLYVIPRYPTRSVSEGGIDLLFQKGLNTSSLQRLEYIDIFVQELLQLKSKQHEIKSAIFIVNQPERSFTESVSDRFYYVQRLKKPLTSLHTFENQYNNFLYYANGLFHSFETKILFRHERIRECIETMELEKSTEPLFLLWYEFTHYKYLSDHHFLEEFIKLIFIAYKNIVINCTQEKKSLTQKTIEQLIQLYEKLDSLPLEEILNAIDTLALELPIISEKYELNSDMPWKQWLRKYWWAPPLIIGTITVRFLYLWQKYKPKNTNAVEPVS